MFELARQRARDLLFGDEAVLDEHAPELAAGALLVGQRLVQLLFGQQLLLHQDLSRGRHHPFFWPCH
jgi:hypothetical protein